MNWDGDAFRTTSFLLEIGVPFHSINLSKKSEGFCKIEFAGDRICLDYNLWLVMSDGIGNIATIDFSNSVVMEQTGTYSDYGLYPVYDFDEYSEILYSHLY